MLLSVDYISLFGYLKIACFDLFYSLKQSYFTPLVFLQPRYKGASIVVHHSVTSAPK